MTKFDITNLQGNPTQIGAEALCGFRGQIISPEHPDYDDARKIWNAMIDKKPGLILRPTGTADVQTAVRLARDHDLLLCVKGGGHNIAGSALCDGGLMIDLREMRSVRVSPEEQRVAVQGGALLGDVDHETQNFDLAVTLGINSTTGVGGLALGGGIGWLSRKFGHTADNIIAMDVVTPDGEFRRASETENADLFWALRGGSGNFGVVTCFEFKCHPHSPDFLSGLVIHPLEDAREVMLKCVQLSKNLPDEAACWLVLRKAPPLPFLDKADHGRPVLMLAMTYAGDAVIGEKVLGPLRQLGSPIADGVAIHPYVNWQAILDPIVTPPARNYWKSHDFHALTADVIDVMVTAVENLPDDECEIGIAHLGGAASRVPSDAIAFPHRCHHYTMNIHGRWQDASKDETCKSWVRKLFSQVTPHATGSVYVNFVSEVETKRDIGPYGANLPRLAAIKRDIDPKNLFRSNINIKPTGE